MRLPGGRVHELLDVGDLTVAELELISRAHHHAERKAWSGRTRRRRIRRSVIDAVSIVVPTLDRRDLKRLTDDERERILIRWALNAEAEVQL